MSLNYTKGQLTGLHFRNRLSVITVPSTVSSLTVPFLLKIHCLSAFQGGCYVLIDGLETTPLQVRDDNLDKTPQPGKGADENQFSVDFDVLFDMEWTEGKIQNDFDRF